MVNQKSDWIQNIPLFKAFSKEEIEKIAEVGEVINSEAEMHVLIEGELSWGIYVVLEGLVGVYKNNKLTKNIYEIGRIYPGNFFGEMSLIDESPRSATVKTLEKTSLFFISKEKFNEYLYGSVHLRIKFYENCISEIVKRIRDLDENYVISQYQLWEVALQLKDHKEKVE